MPFVKIAPKSRSSHNAGAAITIGCYLGEGKSTKGGASTRHVTIRIPYAIMQASGIPTEGRRASIWVHEGTGTDAGFLMVVADVNGYTLTQNKNVDENNPNTGYAANIPLAKFNYYTPNECPVGATMVEHDITADGILIACPDWLRPNIEKMEADGLMPQPEPPPKPVVTVAEVERAIPPTLRGKKNAATAALDALAVIEEDDDPKTSELFKLNRQERRVLAKKVATTIGKR